MIYLSNDIAMRNVGEVMTKCDFEYCDICQNA